MNTLGYFLLTCFYMSLHFSTLFMDFIVAVTSNLKIILSSFDPSYRFDLLYFGRTFMHNQYFTISCVSMMVENKLGGMVKFSIEYSTNIVQ